MAVDPPEVVVDLTPQIQENFNSGVQGAGPGQTLYFRQTKNNVRVLRQEAVGMYEVAVLEAGSAKAL